jgi:hypothetical protein
VTSTTPTDYTAIATTPTRATVDTAARTFSRSMVISGTRCVLTYVVFPWFLPLLGIASGVGPGVGLAVGAIAIWFNVTSIRRFWATGHRMKWAITALNSGVIVLLTILLVIDLRDLLA